LRDGDAGADTVLAKGVVTVSDKLPMSRFMLRDSNEKARWPANAGTQFGFDVVEHSAKAAWQRNILPFQPKRCTNPMRRGKSLQTVWICNANFQTVAS